MPSLIEQFRRKLAPIHLPQIAEHPFLAECKTFGASMTDSIFVPVVLKDEELLLFPLVFDCPLVPHHDNRIDQIFAPLPSAELLEADISSLFVDTVVWEFDLLGLTEILPVMFEPLHRVVINGKVYDIGKDEENHQQKLPFAAQDRRADGYRQSFKERKDNFGRVQRKRLSVWDLIFPILQPPLEFDWGADFDVPSRLWDYQITGVKFLVENESALLGDDMGTGKTIQSIIALRILFQSAKAKSCLIVCPLSVLPGWDNELLKWAPGLSPTIVRGNKQIREQQWLYPAHIYLTTYGTLREDQEYLVQKGFLNKFDVVIADEVHKVKNPGAGIAQAIKSLRAKWRWGLSGTPIENRIEDLYSIFQFIKPGLLRLEGLTPQKAKGSIQPYFLRRRKKEVLKDLPEKHVSHVWVQMEELQRHAYDIAEKEGRVQLEEMGEEITVQHVLALLLRLKQICNFDPKNQESAKWEWLIDQAEQIFENRDKALIFSQFNDRGINWLEKKFGEKNIQVVKYFGGLSDRQRENVVRNFKENPDISFFLGNVKAAGLGLNLTEANYVVHFDHWWNPAVGNQAEDRAHRIGQTKDVFVYRLWTTGTVEERIYKILEGKQALFDDVIDSLANCEGSGLSEDELFELFGLRSPKAKAKTTREGFSGLAPREFEEKIAELFRKWGYGVRLTPVSHDAGVDVIVSRAIPGGTEKIAVQCKLQKDPVGREIAQKLLGVVSNEPSYSYGIIATNSTFSRECQEFASQNGRIQLWDGQYLMRQFHEFGV